MPFPAGTIDRNLMPIVPEVLSRSNARAHRKMTAHDCSANNSSSLQEPPLFRSQTDGSLPNPTDCIRLGRK
jgi:hypothetical protein